jgi:hypothetical protein
VQIIDQTTSAAAHLFAVNMYAQEQHTRNISSLDRSSELAQAFLGLFSMLREELNWTSFAPLVLHPLDL